MLVKTVLRFNYSPPDFFEASTTFPTSFGDAVFDAGIATLVLATPMKPVPDALRNDASREIDTFLRARQAQIGRPFQLEGPGAMHEHDDGTQDAVVYPAPGQMRMSGGRT